MEKASPEPAWAPRHMQGRAASDVIGLSLDIPLLETGAEVPAAAYAAWSSENRPAEIIWDLDDIIFAFGMVFLVLVVAVYLAFRKKAQDKIAWLEVAGSRH